MKICFIADATSIHTIRWVEYFSKMGHEIHLITYEPPKEHVDRVNIHIVDSIFNNLYIAFPFRHIKIMRIVNRIKPDIVHAQFITKFGFHGALLGFHPLIMSAWGSDILVIPHDSSLLWYFTKFSLKKSDLIYAASEDIRNKIIYNFKIDSDKVKLNIHGVNTELFYPANNKLDRSDKIVVCSNRNLSPVYSIETLVDSIPLVIEKSSNIRFMIMGNGLEKERLKQRINDLGVAQYVDFIGDVNHEEMPKYLNSCNIYVSTALSDGTPVSMLEAMACALPCIMTDVGGIREWIKDDVTGFLIKPKHPEDLADKIVQLANDGQIRKFIGNNAHNQVVKLANKTHIMENVLSDYNSLIRK